MQGTPAGPAPLGEHLARPRARFGRQAGRCLASTGAGLRCSGAASGDRPPDGRCPLLSWRRNPVGSYVGVPPPMGAGLGGGWRPARPAAGAPCEPGDHCCSGARDKALEDVPQGLCGRAPAPQVVAAVFNDRSLRVWTTVRRAELATAECAFGRSCQRESCAAGCLGGKRLQPAPSR